jgi:K+-transporting ATPase ATPase A chain
LGTNGGGFFNANSAHPFENPTPSRISGDVLIFAIPRRLTYTLGRMTGSPRHGWAVWGRWRCCFWRASRRRTGPRRAAILCCTESTSTATASQPGGNMEGKEVRFGIANSALFATVTTDASCGAINSMARFLYAAGRHGAAGQHHAERSVFGGVGAGMYGVLIYVVLAVFIAGLMVGARRSIWARRSKPTT